MPDALGVTYGARLIDLLGNAPAVFDRVARHGIV